MARKKQPADTAMVESSVSPPIAVYPLLAYLDELVELLRGYVPRALQQYDVEAIHQARVCSRRLKSALDLIGDVVPPEHLKPFGRVLRKLRRTLGPLRDLDVMIEKLESAGEDDPHRPAARWLADQLAAQRTAARADARPQRVSRFLARLGTWWGLREDLQAIEPAIDSLLAQSLHLQLDAFAEQADALVRSSADASILRPDPHELRIAGKALRYTLDLAGKAGHALPPGAGKLFKHMQELLGNWHDQVVLTERAMSLSLERQLVLHDTALQARILDLAKDAVGLAGDRLGEFAELWKAEGPGLTLGIREAFPLTRPPRVVPPVDVAPVAPQTQE